MTDGLASLSAGNVLANLRAAGAGMSPALARVCDYVLAGPERILGQTITEVAEQSGASEASILRFCREQGFKSFQALKLALAAELAAGKPPPPRANGAEGLIDRAAAAMRDTHALLGDEALDTAADRLIRARRIHLFGFGASGAILRYLHYKLTRLGLASTFGDDLHMSLMAVSAFTPQDVALAVSTSGSTRDTVHIAEGAHAAGAYLIAITNRRKSPLAGVADLTLTAASTGTLASGGGFPARVSQLLIIEMLFERIAKRNGRALKALRTTLASVADRIY